MEKTVTVTVAHTIGAQDPTQFLKLKSEFKKEIWKLNKGKGVSLEIINTTPLAVGGGQISSGVVRAQTVVLITAYFEFECTESEASHFRYMQTKMIGG